MKYPFAKLSILATLLFAFSTACLADPEASQLFRLVT